MVPTHFLADDSAADDSFNWLTEAPMLMRRVTFTDGACVAGYQANMKRGNSFNAACNAIIGAPITDLSEDEFASFCAGYWSFFDL